MLKHKYLNILISTLVVASLIFGANFQASAQQQASAPQQNESIKKSPTPQPPSSDGGTTNQDRVTPAERQAAADRNTALGRLPGFAQPAFTGLKNNKPGMNGPAMSMPDSSVDPHYFGPFANYANSPLPKGPITGITLEDGGTGYTAPTVSILDVYGTGIAAAASATVVDGVITDITLTDGGDGYSAPVILIQDATGSGAVATPTIGGTTNSLSGGIKKFVDSLPGLTPAGQNALGNYIPIATPDKVTYGPAFNATYPADYYEIALVQYTQQLHSDLPATTLRGYVQLSTAAVPGDHIQLFYPDGSPIRYTDNSLVYAVDAPHYLGPLIIAKENTAVRIKFYNFLPTGQGGDLFLPVDTTVMGAGEGPLQADGVTECNPDLPVSNCESYSQNRATIHMHGALVPWISDGTPHQWTTPAGENTVYPKGVSVQNVPDMPNPGDGSLTFYYNNQQSARLMFYHDHSYGITRLNVYAGEAAGYVITDQVEQDLINGTNASGVNPGLVKVLPDIGTPLIFQDKTFVDETTIAAQDPTWKWGTGAIVNGRRQAKTGDLWTSSVYMTAQNPWDLTGANAFGRWMYGPWFNPPTTDVINQPVTNEYYDPGCDAASTWCEPPVKPVMPSPSMGMEAFNDTALVNGQAYPYMVVDPKTYRFRVLNAANDRFINLQMYVADPTVVTADGRTNTEVKMVPAIATTGFPAKWSTDGRVGGVPDPATAGPAWIQIGTEGGFLPAPVLLPNQPINWNMNPTAFNVGNVTDHSLLLGPAERADVIVDFSQYAGQTIIVYNDAPAAFPALDPRYDYYTGNPSQMDTGGAPTTQAGYGPNTRTFMQIRVTGTASGTPPANYYNPTTLSMLQSVFAKSGTKRGVFEVSHPNEPIIIPQAAYNSAYEANLPGDAASQYVQIGEASKTFTPLNSSTPVTIKFETKAMHDEMGAAYDVEFGRMSSMLGVDVPGASATTQNIVLSGYASPPVDLMQNSIVPIGTFGDGTQIWKIMHNGVDTHPIHFHLFNVQLINRVGWDGALLPPEPNEIGWKETVRVNPLEDTIIAMRPVATTQPFEIPNSIRMIDPTKPAGYQLMGGPGGMVTPGLDAVTVFNHPVNYGWEYVWHCHILSHEEMDMMHSLAFGMNPDAPSLLTANGVAGTVHLTWLDNSINETNFTIQRISNGVTTTIVVPSVSGPSRGTTVTYDDTVTAGNPYSYRVLASNIIGDTATYPGSLGYPTKSVDSMASNLAANMISVLSILRASPNPTNAASVDFTVTFAQPVTGLVAGDFSLSASTVSGAAITNISPASGPADVYTVTVDTGINTGTLQLDMTNVLLGGPFTFGETYAVEKIPPLVSSIVRASADPSNMTGVNYTVTFTEPVTGVDKTDFNFTTTGVFSVAPAVTAITGTGTTYTITVGKYFTNSGTLRLDLVDNNSIVDAAGASLGGTLAGDGNFTTGDAYSIDNVAPTVVSSVRVDANPSRFASVSYTVTFSEAVTGVDKTDFLLTTTPGISGASVTGVSGTGTTRTVVVNTGSGDGTLRLNVLDNNTVVDALSNPLGGPGVGNGDYISGETYIIDKTPPKVASSLNASPNPTYLSNVNFSVTFTKPITGITAADFALATSGVTGASIVSINGSGSTYSVAVDTGTGNGTIHLNVLNNNSIVDAAGNVLKSGYTSGVTYDITKEFTLSVISANGTVARNPDQPTYHEGDVVQLTATPIADWSFANWTGGLTSAINPDSVTIHGDTSVTANYTQNEYTLTVNSAHGTIAKNPDQATYHEGDVVQLTATPTVGWSFANWTGDLTSSVNPASITIHGNTAATVNYTQNEYSLTVTSAHGTVVKNPNQATYHEGDVVQLTATPTVGWSFANWTGDLTSSVNPASITIHGNTAATANYTQNEYSLTVTSAHGTVAKNPDQATYHEGDVVQLTATPTVGWTFANWTGDLTSSVNPASITIHGNASVTANYTQYEYSLTITSAHGTVAQNPNQATYHEGDVVQLTSTPAAGWSFANWSGGLTGTANPGSVTIHGNTSITANYAVDNQAPTEIAISNSIVAENQASGTTVGTFTSTDPNVGDTFTYTLISGAGSVDNAAFTISGNTLKTAYPFNSAVKNSYSFRVRTTDSGGLYFEKAFTITVTNLPAIFVDVPDTFWAVTWIERLYNDGVTNGCSTSPLKYCPAAVVTRADMAIFLLRGEHGATYNPPAATGTKFGDVPAGKWAAAWIEQLAAEGITNGCGGGNYCPDMVVTRAQMAVFLLRAKHGSSYVPPSANGDFKDVSTSYWAAAWIEQLAAESITTGCGNGNYCPDVAVTRAEMAVFLVRTFNLP